MKYLIVLFCACFALGVACTPDIINHNEKPTETSTEVVNTDSGSPDQLPTSCKNDCECEIKGLGVCQNGTCQPLKRASLCKTCHDPTCIKGEMCILSINGTQLSTCTGTKECRTDCDCVKAGKQRGCGATGMCDSPNKNIPSCPDCNSPCPVGDSCQMKENGKTVYGTCQDWSCKDDCDCATKKQGVCESGTCNNEIERGNRCASCDTCTNKGDRCLNTDDSIGTCEPKPMSCKSDCDCIAAKKGVCEGGTCNQVVARAGNCAECGSPNCKPGDACLNSDNTVGTCGTTSCKHDCECQIDGKGVCESGSCTTLVNRASTCKTCHDPTCTNGEMCILSINGTKLSTCQKTIKCSNDCECQAQKAGVCESGVCNDQIRRASNCPSCESVNCKVGTPCIHQSNGALGKCSETTPCSHDCDCLTNGVCHQGTCQPLKRASQCVACSGNCTKGDPCVDSNGKIGTCGGTACKHDCDCIGNGVCHQGTCQPLKRASQCLSCAGNCTKGDPCLDINGNISTCGGTNKTFQCGNKTCQSGTEYCYSITGGAAPSCGMPGQASCPSHCSPYGLGCADGLKRCNCPSYSCRPRPSNCNDCKCAMGSTGGGCGTGGLKNGELFCSCAAP